MGIWLMLVFTVFYCLEIFGICCKHSWRTTYTCLTAGATGKTQMGWCGPSLSCFRVSWGGAQKVYFRTNFHVCQQDLRVGIDVSGKRDARVGTSLAFFQGRSSQHLWMGFSNATTAASFSEARFCQMPVHFFRRHLIFSFKRVGWKINWLSFFLQQRSYTCSFLHILEKDMVVYGKF